MKNYKRKCLSGTRTDLKDNWIYIEGKSVTICRTDVFWEHTILNSNSKSEESLNFKEGNSDKNNI